MSEKKAQRPKSKVKGKTARPKVTCDDLRLEAFYRRHLGQLKFIR